MSFINTFANFNITSFGFPPKINIGFNFGWNINPLGGLGCFNNFSWNINPFSGFGCFNNVGLYGYFNSMNTSCFNYYGNNYSEPPTMFDTFSRSTASFDYTNSSQSYQTWDYTSNPYLTSDMKYDWTKEINKIKLYAPNEKKKEKEEAVDDEFTGSLEDYDKNKGEKLAEIALKNSDGWKSMCATYVKNAIKEAELGEYIEGDAHEMDTILASNDNFKKIDKADIDLNSLPAGCILVYEKGVQGYNEEYGHVEITTGDGRGVSDGITQNLREPSSIFIPV